MYLHLYLLILVGVLADYTRAGRCDSEKKVLWPSARRLPTTRHKLLDKAVTQIVTETIKAERLIQNFCNSHADHHMRETYEMEHFKLSLSVDDFDEETISVKVMNRIVYVRAEDCSSTYADVRILPEVVDVTKGNWIYALGELTIRFPYIITPDIEVVKVCRVSVNTNVIVVPKCEESVDLEPDTDIRFGDATQRNMFKENFGKKSAVK